MSRSWPTVRLGDLLRRSEETVDLHPSAEYRQITVRLWGKGVVLRRILTGAEIAGSRQRVARHGQFILSRIDARNGALGIVPRELDEAIVTNDFPVFNVVRDRLLPAYLGWMCQTASFVEECRRASEGTTNRVRLQEDKLLAHPVPLPALPEQRRIVARIEELAAQIQEARTLRQTSRDETVAFLQAAKRMVLSSGRNERRLRLNEIAELRYGISAPISNATDPALGQPIIRMANISLDGDLDLSDMRYIPASAEEREQFRLQRRDLLLNWRSGSAQHVGKTAIFDGEGEYLFASFLLRIRPVHNMVLAEFLKFTLNFMRAEGVFLDAQRFQVNTKLNASEFGEFGISLPGLSEQRRIVAELDALQGEVDTLKRLQAETAAELDALLPSILDKAFNGEL
jgi:type I restriction enzyme S subunit